MATFQSRTVCAEFKEIPCPHCRQGVLRVIYPQPAWTPPGIESVGIECAPIGWDMRCHTCQRVVQSQLPGPFLVYRERNFVLLDSVEEKMSVLRAFIRQMAKSKGGDHG